MEQREKQLAKLTVEYKELKRRLDVSEERYQSLLQDKNEIKNRLEMKHNEVVVTSDFVILIGERRQ